MIKVVNEKAHSPNAYQEGYQQALDDFGLTQLLERLSKFSDSDFDAQWLVWQEKELESLAAQLIGLMSTNLQGNVIVDTLKAMRQGYLAVLSSLPVIDFGLPQSVTLPADRSVPLFWLGDSLGWRRVPGEMSADFGVVIGRFYLPAVHRGLQWSWKYLILLDQSSPSAAWTVADTAWEEDLQPPDEEEGQ